MKWMLWSLLILAMPCPGQMYEWVDENGQRHFSDKKPAQGTDYRIRDEADTGSLSTYSSPELSQDPSSRRDSRSDSSGRSRSRRGVRGSGEDKAEVRCQAYLERLDRIQDKLRRGYSEPKGNNLRRQRRDVSARYQRDCQ